MLQEKTAVVYGGGGSVGGAIARTLHARGASVVLSGRREDALNELRASLGDRSETIVARPFRNENAKPTVRSTGTASKSRSCMVRRTTGTCTS